MAASAPLSLVAARNRIPLVPGRIQSQADGAAIPESIHLTLVRSPAILTRAGSPSPTTGNIAFPTGANETCRTLPMPTHGDLQKEELVNEYLRF